jgi:hypothetical protein
MKIYAATALLSLASAVLAFEATVPCIMWSPKKYVHVCNDDKNWRFPLFNSYIDATVKTNIQFVISKSDASSVIFSSLSSDICSAKVIALVNQPEVIAYISFAPNAKLITCHSTR